MDWASLSSSLVANIAFNVANGIRPSPSAAKGDEQRLPHGECGIPVRLFIADPSNIDEQPSLRPAHPDFFIDPRPVVPKLSTVDVIHAEASKHGQSRHVQEL